MARSSFRTLVVLGFLILCLAAYSQTTEGAAEPLLGSGHIWLKAGQTDLRDAAAGAWGVEREGYFALEGYWASRIHEWYTGAELGLTATDSAVTDDGETIRDFGFWWIEINSKRAFDLKHGLTIDVGMGVALFFVEGEEENSLGGTPTTDPLADFGFGAQAFTDFTWRTRHLLIGLDAKYQWAMDIINIDYSNLRLGAHIGFCF